MSPESHSFPAGCVSVALSAACHRVWHCGPAINAKQFLSFVQLGVLHFQDRHCKEEDLLEYKKRRLLNTMVSTKDHYPHPYGCCSQSEA